MRPRRAAAGLVLGAAGMIASRLSGKRRAERPAVEPEPGASVERAPTTDEIARARADLSEELARRSARADNSPG